MSHEDEDAACPECDGIDKHAAGCPWLDDVRTLHDGEHDDHISHPHYGAACMVTGNDWRGPCCDVCDACGANGQGHRA